MNQEPKDRILTKAHGLFMQFGIRSISMDDIANHLGMSKKTLYQYYADKDELVHAVIDSHINGVQGDCINCSADARDAIDELLITIDQVLAEFSNINPMLLHDLQKFHFRAYERFLQFKNKFLADMIRKNIEWGIRDELYREDLNTDILVKYRLEAMMLSFDVGIFPPGKYNLTDTSKVIMEHFIYGLVTLKGHKLISKYQQYRIKHLLSSNNNVYGK